MVSKSEPIGRHLMLIMIRALLREARTPTEQRSSVENWAALVMTFAACGRGGECAQTRNCGFRVSDLVAWGDAVKSRWQADNAKAPAGDTDLAVEVTQLRTAQAETSRLLERQSQQLAEQNQMLQTLLQNKMQWMAGSKRTRDDDLIAPSVISSVVPSVLPPHVVIPPRTASAFDVLMKTPPIPIEFIPCTLNLYDFLIVWFERRFKLGEYKTRWTAKTRQEKDRIKKVLDEVSILAAGGAIDINAVGQERNFTQLSDACRAIVELVYKKIW